MAAASTGVSRTPANLNGAITIDASAQAHEQTPASSSEADRDAIPNGSHTVVSPDERDSAKAGDKDKSSLAATTNTQPNTSSTNTTTSAPRRFSRKSKPKPEKSVASTTSALDKSPPKESFISKLVRKLVPCVAPNERAHVVEIDNIDTQGLTPPSRPSEPLVMNEKLQVTPDEPKDKDTETALHAPSLPPQDSSIVAAAHDMDIHFPTPPKADLPPSETSGINSGSPQPPAPSADIFSPTPVSHSEPSHSTQGNTSVHLGDVTHSTATESEGGFTDDEAHADGDEVEVDEGDPMEGDDEDALIMNGGAGIPIGPDGTPRPLLPPIAPQHVGRKCLVLDLDETLVHSSFKSIQHADYVVPVEIEYHWHNVYVIKRPGVDNFLKRMGEIYEVVVFTASLSKYADPVLDKLDIHHVVSHRLFRESCYNHKGNYVKDLSQLGRPIADTIIIDNSPASYIFHPNNAVPVSSWFNDPHDTELTDLCPFLADLGEVPDVRGVLDGGL